MKSIFNERFFLSITLLFLAGCKKSDPAAPSLAINGFSPSHGPEATTVVITGTGFSATPADDNVTLNNKTAMITSASSTQLVATVPRQAGTGKIVVTVHGKTLEGGVFTYDYSDAQVTTLAGSGTIGTADGTGTAASFNSPGDLAIDANGNLYVADVGASTIREVTPAGVVTTIAGGRIGFLDGASLNARFNGPNGLTIDAAGNLYVTDGSNNAIRKIDHAGNVTTIAGTGVQGNANGPAATAQFAYPDGLTMDGAGNIYVADHFSRIRKITTQGMVSTLTGMNTQGYLDGPLASAQFAVPRGMLFDSSGNLFVCDQANSLIRKITPAGNATTWAGSTPGFADGSASAAQFNYPFAMATDSSGNLLVTDGQNNCIRMITPAGMVSTVAGNRTAGYADGNKATTRFSGVTGIVVGKDGSIYVAEFLNHRIRKIVLE
ncbi:MAG TPA: SMP-30/gluconolactonase/LRE family protein [Puia sp.]|nr:SMP-30/gluconolactonase/LRE family protein [Puia sp.]